MKLDWNLMRQIVLAAECSAKAGLPEIKGYSREEVGYHAYLLVEYGLARGYSVQNTGHQNPFFSITSLRPAGHEFAELARDDARWMQALVEAQHSGALTLSVLRELLSRPLRSQEKVADVAKTPQKDLMYIITNKALLFHLPGRNGGTEQRLQIGPGGPHLVPAWIRETPTFEPASRDGSLREVEIPSSPNAVRQSDFTPIADPAALSPGREFPRWLYHATQRPQMVMSREEEARLGREWSRVYIHQEYPKVKYHWNGKDKTVQNAEEEAALGGGWANNPGAFNPYKGPRPPRTDDQDPAKWVGEWSVPGLTDELRKKIKVQLLRADVVFDRSPDRDAGALAAMRQAFDGIVKLLLDAGILTEDLLRKDVPHFVWNSAIAGGWWLLASEFRRDIFPEQIGHYWVWREDNAEALGLFRAEIRHWVAELLDAPGPTPAIPVSRDRQCREQPAESNDSSLDFDSETGRIDAIAAYIKHWTTESWKCAEASLARTATVDPADLSKWKKGLLPEGSDKKSRIERALKNNEPPTPPPAREPEA